MTTEVAKTNGENVAEFVPLGEAEPIKLTIGMVRNIVCEPTRSGKQPTDKDVINFIMLCKARQLNPFTGDAWLVGYDSQGGAQFSLITSVQSLLKRAEASGKLNGLEAGVIIQSDGDVVERAGTLVLDGETLVGAWAKCYRHDCNIPFYTTVKFKTYDTGRSRWKADPEGMIVKCARAAVLRLAFPLELGGLYTQDEREHEFEQPRVQLLESKPADPAEVFREPIDENPPQHDEPTILTEFNQMLAACETKEECQQVFNDFASERPDAETEKTMRGLRDERISKLGDKGQKELI